MEATPAQSAGARRHRTSLTGAVVMGDKNGRRVEKRGVLGVISGRASVSTDSNCSNSNNNSDDVPEDGVKRKDGPSESADGRVKYGGSSRMSPPAAGDASSNPQEVSTMYHGESPVCDCG